MPDQHHDLQTRDLEPFLGETKWKETYSWVKVIEPYVPATTK